MGSQRIFLGWNRPLCETVPAYLLAGANAGMLDLRGTRVVTPTRQSSWRLRAALPVAAEARGVVLLGPEIVTPPVLLAPPASSATATSLDSLLAWNRVLNGVEPGAFAAFLGARANRPSGAGWALPIARRLQELRRELADGGLNLRGVVRDGKAGEEGERWSEMAELERRYLGQLEAWKLRDAIEAQLDHAFGGARPSETQRVVVAAVPDPPQLLLTLLARWSDAGLDVVVLVAAPEEEASSFDAWGRPLPDAWRTREIPLRAEDIWIEATPEDQAARIAKTLSPCLQALPASAPDLRPQLAIGAADRETVAPLQRELAAIGLSAFDPQNRPFAETALFRLVQSLLALRTRAGYAEVASLLRHPDALAAVGRGAGTLRELDAFQAEHLPVTLDDLRAREAPGAAHPPAHAVERVRTWRDGLLRDDIATALRHALQEIYGSRLLKSGNPADDAFQQAGAAFDTGLRELEGALLAGRAGADADQALLERLREASLKAERRDERVEIEGWLELAWNPAPLLFVAGMNEGFVPDGHVGDLFLPDTLRRALDLRDDRRRAARDAYALTALLEQRRGCGRVILLAGKTANAGDPLRPSRLLVRCPDTELATRARMLSRNPPASHGAQAFAISFKLDPARLPAGSADDTRSREMSPTLFRAYLDCPLRFYLRQALGMRPLDDRAREPDALAFGNLMHAVLDEMAQAGVGLWGCGDAERLAHWLEERLRGQVRARYGAQPWLGVLLALDSGVRRLRAFARKQVEWHAEGWDIVEHETAVVCAVGGLTVRGRSDRVDRNRTTGAVCVLDYKTTEQARTPAETHLGPVRDDDDLPEAAVPAATAGNRNARRWTDLQLPLYQESLRSAYGADVRPGYILLPGALGETGFSVWEAYSEALHCSAIACAAAVARRIRAGVFWPPGKRPAGHTDDLEGLLLDDPLKTMLRPEAPWGRPE